MVILWFFLISWKIKKVISKRQKHFAYNQQDSLMTFLYFSDTKKTAGKPAGIFLRGLCLLI